MAGPVLCFLADDVLADTGCTLVALYGVAELVIIETGADIGQWLDNALSPIRRSRMAAESSKGVVICGGIRCAYMLILLVCVIEKTRYLAVSSLL